MKLRFLLFVSLFALAGSATAEVINLYLSDYESEEVIEGQPVNFYFYRRDTNISQPVEVTWQADPASTRLSPSSGSVSIPGGQRTANVTIETIDDGIFTTDTETITLSITSPNDATFSTSDTFKLHENDYTAEDQVTFEIAQDLEWVFENDTVEYFVRRTGGLHRSVEVRYCVGLDVYPGTQFWSCEYEGTVAFEPGETLKAFQFHVRNDDEFFLGTRGGIVMIGPTQNPSITIGNNWDFFTIANDGPPPTITVEPVSVTEGDTGETIVTITVQASERTEFSMNYELVPQSASENLDYVVPSSTHISLFRTSQAQFTVKIKGDLLPEPDEQLLIRFYSNDDPPWPVSEVPEPVTLTILNDDPAIPMLSPDNARVAAGEAATFVLDLDIPVTEPTAVPITADRSIVHAPEFVLFAPGESEKVFEVSGITSGSSEVSATLPNGTVLRASISVYVNSEIVVEPRRAATRVGDSTTISVRLNPPLAEAHTLRVASTNPAIATVTAEVIVPANGSGTFTVDGIAPGGTFIEIHLPASLGGDYMLLPVEITAADQVPAILSIAPAAGSTSGGTLVRANVNHVSGGCWIFFGDTPATETWVNSATEMIAVTPPNSATGPVNVPLRCGSDSATLVSAFTYSSAPDPAPAIVSVDPLSGAPGETVTIRGINFRTTDQVSFDAQRAVVLGTLPDAHVVQIPDLPAGTARIEVVDVDGRMATTIFIINAPATPVIHSVTPSNTVAGAEIVLSGRGFRSGLTFSIGGTTARIVSIAFDRAVLRLSPAIPTGVHPIEVFEGSTRLATGPNVTIAASGIMIRSVAPNCDTTNGGATVTIIGSGFASGATVTFDGLTSTDVEVVSASVIRAVAPPNTAGDAAIVVTNSGGALASASDAFTYRSPFDPIGCTSRGRSIRR